MKLIRTAIFSCTFLFAVGAFALQYPSGGQPQAPRGSMQPSQPSPNQQPGNPPSQDPNAQPGQQPSQSAPSSSGAPTIDDQVRSLSDQLNLSPDQQAKVKTALEEQHTQAMSIVQDNNMPREDKISKIHGLRETTINKVRTALNDDQKKKFDAMIQEMDQRQQQQQSAQPAPKQ